MQPPIGCCYPSGGRCSNIRFRSHDEVPLEQAGAFPLSAVAETSTQTGEPALPPEKESPLFSIDERELRQGQLQVHNISSNGGGENIAFGRPKTGSQATSTEESPELKEDLGQRFPIAGGGGGRGMMNGQTGASHQGDSWQDGMRGHVESLRRRLLAYSPVEHRQRPDLDYSQVPERCDVLVFGPSGSGKSSLLRTFYRALHACVGPLPKEVSSKLVVKDAHLNEGTLKYSSATMTSRLCCHDSRGQIWMDTKEESQLLKIIAGHIKEDAVVVQRNWRNPALLWEFWKPDTELFPREILREQTGLGSMPHALIFVFDGSSSEVLSEEEFAFYRGVLSKAQAKGYFYPQVVLTHIDLLIPTEEKKAGVKSGGRSAEEELLLQQTVDQKSSLVAAKLGVPRGSVHFVENYHGAEQDQGGNAGVDFNALRILDEACRHADAFLQQRIAHKVWKPFGVPIYGVPPPPTCPVQ